MNIWAKTAFRRDYNVTAAVCRALLLLMFRLVFAALIPLAWGCVMKKVWFLRVFAAFLIVIGVVIGAFVVWGNTPPAPMPQALAALQSDDRVDVSQEQWLVFAPVGAQPVTGLVFYPGGRVDPRSYAPYARAIAETGYLVVIVPMPLNLAVFNLNAADAVIAAYPDVTTWAVGGHSLGGAMAARYVFEHPQYGLTLWASYPDLDMSSYVDTPMQSIYGTLDGLATVVMIDESRQRMPPSAQFVVLEGGNHAQFGWYGSQAGDMPATMPHEEQQRLVVVAVIGFLASLPEALPAD